MADAEDRERRIALGVSWLAYATSYLGRKGFSAVKKPLGEDLGLSKADLGLVDTGFLAAYAAGQFVSGIVGDRTGARRLVGVGLLVSAAACFLMGSAASAGALLLFFTLNGLAQSTGWPGTTRVVSEWTPQERRGRVMSWWSTCYQVGGLVATPFAAFLAARAGWPAAFYVPAAILAVVGLLVLARLRSPRAPRAEVPSRDTAPPPSVPLSAQLAVYRNRTLWLYGSSYFFIKLIRYALLFWLPFYLSDVSGYSTEKAGLVSAAFDAGGIAGVLAIGRPSDRSRLGRAGLSALWLVGLALSLFAYAFVGSTSTVANVGLLAVIGALLFGPDSLLSGAAAQDAGGAQAASSATGFVNGLGSLGALLQGLIVPALADRFGWRALFPVFVGLALLAALTLVPTFRRRQRDSEFE